MNRGSLLRGRVRSILDRLPRLGKGELVCLLLFTCNYVVSVGEGSSSSGRLGWALSLPYNDFGHVT